MFLKQLLVWLTHDLFVLIKT